MQQGTWADLASSVYTASALLLSHYSVALELLLHRYVWAILLAACLEILILDNYYCTERVLAWCNSSKLTICFEHSWWVEHSWVGYLPVTVCHQLPYAKDPTIYSLLTHRSDFAHEMTEQTELLPQLAKQAKLVSLGAMTSPHWTSNSLGQAHSIFVIYTVYPGEATWLCSFKIASLTAISPLDRKICMQSTIWFPNRFSLAVISPLLNCHLTILHCIIESLLGDGLYARWKSNNSLDF